MKNSTRMNIARLLLLSALACAPLAQGGELKLKIGNHAISAEVADTPEAREHGLMQRKTLCADCGMLFVFPAAARFGFWMKNTSLPLAIAFIAGDGRIINIEEMQPDSLDIHYPQADALYVLEMNSGWFAAHHVKPGDSMSSGSALPVATK
jgi:uncharacterized membrane protein (UPF0127 family)